MALYYLTPSLLGALFGSLRGFAGEITAAQSLDVLASDGNAVLIDIRTEARHPPIHILPTHHAMPSASKTRNRWLLYNTCTHPFSPFAVSGIF